MFTLLIIDDEPNIAFSVSKVFETEGLRVISAESAEIGLMKAATENPDVVLLDIRLGQKNGLEVFEELRRRDPKCLVIFITGHGSAETAIEAMKRGAYDYLLKPLDFHQLRQVVTQACEISRLMHVPTLVDGDERPAENPDRLVGQGAAMQLVCKQIGRIAPQDVNVLVLGESGTGKELVARALYHHSRRQDKPFLAINCGAIAEGLLESELFGHERGAFTGADRRRIGKFEQCHGGTLFLDEAGDMPLATQVKLLRLLQEGTFERVGGNETIHVDVRVIAATNQNLDQMIEQDRFRRDLFYRLKGVSIHLPPLRDRREDIPELAHYFLFRFNRQLGTAIQTIQSEAIELLQNYSWPGNVRELQSAIRESLIVAAGTVLLPEFLPPELRSVEVPDVPLAVPLDDRSTDTPHFANSQSSGSSTSDEWNALAQFLEFALRNGEKDIYRRALEHFDRIILLKALSQSSGQQVKAASLLGISRPTLRTKLRVAGLTVEKIATPRSG